LSSWARVGAKCVCIKKDHWVDAAGLPSTSRDPSFGEICEVTGTTDSFRLPGATLLYLKGYGRFHYLVDHFRPVVPPKAKTQADDIALIKSLLTPAPELVE